MLNTSLGNQITRRRKIIVKLFTDDYPGQYARAVSTGIFFRQRSFTVVVDVGLVKSMSFLTLGVVAIVGCVKQVDILLLLLCVS